MRIGPLPPADDRAAADVLAAVFADDPLIARFIAGDDRPARLRSFYLSAVRSARAGGGAVDGARDDDGTLLGVAVWVAPRRGTLARLRTLRHGWGQARALRLHGVRALRAYIRATAPHRVRLPHWELEDLAVAEQGRGRGIGSQLLAHRLALLDARGGAAALESTTTGSRRLYQRHGFAVVAEVPFRGAGEVTLMVRHPRKSPATA